MLETRGVAFYSEAAAQMIASLHDGTGDVQRRRTQRRAITDLPASSGRESRPDRPDGATRCRDSSGGDARTRQEVSYEEMRSRPAVGGGPARALVP